MAEDKTHYSETDPIRSQHERTSFREHSVPIYLTSSFVFEDAEQARALFADEVPGNIYTRFSNPNNTEFIDKLCKMEGTEDGLATASGMAAMYISMASLVKAGDHILASRSVFGSTHQILNTIFPRFNITSTYVDLTEPEVWESKIQPNTKMIFVETPSNPALDMIDLEWLGKLAQKHKLILNVDNCFATPYLQRPAQWGAHLGLGLAGLIAGMALFAFRVMGGGDAKLIAAATLWLGTDGTLAFLVYTALAGGVLTLGLMWARRNLAQLAPSLPGPLGRHLEAKGDIPYGVAICVSGLLAIPHTDLLPLLGL